VLALDHLAGRRLAEVEAARLTSRWSCHCCGVISRVLEGFHVLPYRPDVDLESSSEAGVGQPAVGLEQFQDG
jgi:hypothetical protein